jgi:hypothetical protein
MNSPITTRLFFLHVHCQSLLGSCTPCTGCAAFCEAHVLKIDSAMRKFADAREMAA